MDLHIPEPFALRLRHRIRKRALAERLPQGLSPEGSRARKQALSPIRGFGPMSINCPHAARRPLALLV